MSKQLRNCKDGADHRDNIHNQRAADRAEGAVEDIGLNRLHIGSYCFCSCLETQLGFADLGFEFGAQFVDISLGGEFCALCRLLHTRNGCLGLRIRETGFAQTPLLL